MKTYSRQSSEMQDIDEIVAEPHVRRHQTIEQRGIHE
jgi:hypothetical protein